MFDILKVGEGSKFMDFAQRGNQQQPASVSTGGSSASGSGGHHKVKGGTMWSKLSALILLVSGAVLLMAMVIFLITGKPSTEGKFVTSGKYQAVFLNGGQVYFGKVKDLNNSFLRLDDIYYLRVNQTVQPNQTSTSSTSNDVSLVKLGCELHGPQDEMLINREQIIFWENLKTDGQVAKAVAEYQKQNPNGQKCDTTTSNSTTPSTTTNKQ